ncbi:hypothetical protein C8R45DRAFT_957331 [Mycena sanguinolenta]|nr:hypothetical protein C8R45DRAFT_957331 [Mycena sanguinolenta]
MEEDIDNESLQAQIDLSLSYAQNLVSSWVKPSSKSTKNSKQALEAELKEYMRRPPRLGVGAPIPEVAAASSRDTQRLKSHLSDKRAKRTRGDEDNEFDSKQLSDAEEDSRGASIKKKPRLDPFEPSGKKKKVKEASKLPTPPSLPQKIAGKEISVEDAGGSKNVAAAPEQASPPPSPQKRKKKKHKNKGPLQVLTDSESLPEPSKTPLPPTNSQLDDTSVSENRKDPAATEVFDISALVSSAPASPVSPARDRRSPQNSPLLKGPLLNLSGPPPSDDESGEEGELVGSTTTSPKKKRRKRNKKKKSLLG